jgi:hypothetical protein
MILRNYADHVQVLFTDVEAPGTITGARLAIHTQEHWPWIGLVMVSGKPELRENEMPVDARFSRNLMTSGRSQRIFGKSPPLGNSGPDRSWEARATTRLR